MRPDELPTVDGDPNAGGAQLGDGEAAALAGSWWLAGSW
jgi:hypothetical protein